MFCALVECRFCQYSFSGMKAPPVVMTVAGSDNSAGAGIQADLKTMSALGVYGVTALTCVVAEVPGKVSCIQPVESSVVAEQIRLLFEAFPISAVKTGMLYSAETLRVVSQEIAGFRAAGGNAPVVVDPVMVATSGDVLLQKDALESYKALLLPAADLVTPNLDEAAVLWGQPVASMEAMREVGRYLSGVYKTAFLIKGGHLRTQMAVDLLVERDGTESWYEAPFVDEVSTHGTGCTYSAAIAAWLGRGQSLPEAVGKAKAFVSDAIGGYLRWSHGSNRKPVDALDHFATIVRK